MNIRNCYILALLASALVSNAQEPSQLWLNEWDGLLTVKKDKGNSILTDANGNVFVTGIVHEQDSKGDFATACYDAAGELLFTHYYNGDNTLRCEGQDLAIAPDGSIYATGIVSSNEGDICLLKFNADGNIWQQSYQPWFMVSYYDEGKEIAIDEFGNIFMAARIESIGGNMADTYTAKFQPDGTLEWGIDYSGASDPDFAAGIALSPGGKVYTATSAFNFFGSATQDMQTICYNSEGGQQWVANYTGTASTSNDWIKDVCVDENDNTGICGSLNNASMDFAVRFQNNFSTPLWSYTKDGSANANDTAVVVCHHPMGLVATGKIVQDINGNDITSVYTVLLDENGAEIWSHVFNGDESLGAEPQAMVLDENGNIYISGWVKSSSAGKNALVLRYSQSGILEYVIEHNGSFNLDDSFRDIALDVNNDLVVTGQSFTSATNSVFVTAKYANGSSSLILQPSDKGIFCFPNPAVNSITIQGKGLEELGFMELWTTEGGLVFSQQVREMPFQLNLNDVSNGGYLVLLRSKNSLEILGMERIIKQQN